jgi:hypothetical protein
MRIGIGEDLRADCNILPVAGPRSPVVEGDDHINRPTTDERRLTTDHAILAAAAGDAAAGDAATGDAATGDAATGDAATGDAAGG